MRNMFLLAGQGSVLFCQGPGRRAGAFESPPMNLVAGATQGEQDEGKKRLIWG